MMMSLDASPSSHLPISSFGPGGNAIAQAASQAIAATQQLTGRRTSSLKASFEAVNLGMQSHEFSIGRELAGKFLGKLEKLLIEFLINAFGTRSKTYFIEFHMS